MSITIDTARSLLIGAARERYNADQQRQEALTGRPAVPVSSDTALIAASPPLAQELQALNAKDDSQANFSDSNAKTGSASDNGDVNNNGNSGSSNTGSSSSSAGNINNDSLVPDQLKKKFNIIA